MWAFAIMKLLWLSEKEVGSLISMEEVLKLVEEAFKEKGEGHVQMPPKPYLFYSRYNGDLRIMPSYLERLDISAVKVVNVHPNNPSEFNLPSIMALIILIDPKNGAPLAILGGTQITAMRTGAAGGVAAKYLARKDSKKVGIIGAGVQARTQLQALDLILEDLEEVKVWSRTSASANRFVMEMRTKVGKGIEITPEKDAQCTVEGVDVLVTTTPSRKPLVRKEWIPQGVHINCIGPMLLEKKSLNQQFLRVLK